jgi:hypothetical protein
MPDKAAAILDRYRKDMLNPDDFIFPALKKLMKVNLKRCIIGKLAPKTLNDVC